MRGVPAGYLSMAPDIQRRALAEANEAGYAAVQRYLAAGDAVALLGAGTSAPLYTAQDDLIRQLVHKAASSVGAELTRDQLLTQDRVAEATEAARRSLGLGGYREALREVLRPRIDPVSGRSWTAVQELVCRCNFKGIVSTCFDSGITDARLRVRPDMRGTGFATWQDRPRLEWWLAGGDPAGFELPVLFAHGYCGRPDSVLLTPADFERAYSGGLAQVLERLDSLEHLVWIGFSQAEPAILRYASAWRAAGVQGGVPQHVVILPWDPGQAPDWLALRRLAEQRYSAGVVLYPAPGGDQSALSALLEGLCSIEAASPASPVIMPPDVTTACPAPARRVPIAWEPSPEGAEQFTGRAEELARLTRWAADPGVRLVAVTAWGGAGKTALVTHWALEAGWAESRSEIQGVFAWSFYAFPDASHWASTLLYWAHQQGFGMAMPEDEPAAAVMRLLQRVPLLLVLDGLEVLQEESGGGSPGRLLDGILREVLTTVCQVDSASLVVLTSRFPFADLEAFDGGSARFLDVPAFTAADGAALLAAGGAGWLAEDERVSLVMAVDGHALAIAALAATLRMRISQRQLSRLRASLAGAAGTSARVGLTLRFYGERLGEAERYLLAAVSLFARPIPAEAVLAVARHPSFCGCLDDWTPDRVTAAVRAGFGGLVCVNPDETLSAHPLVRAAFRPLALGAASEAETVLMGRPSTAVSRSDELLQVVELLELLIEADLWRNADELYVRRTDTGAVFQRLPAASLGQRAARAFVGSSARRAACAEQLNGRDFGFYVNSVGFHAMNAGDMDTAREYLSLAASYDRDEGETKGLAISLSNLSKCHRWLGDIDSAAEAVAESGACAERLPMWELRCDFHVQRAELSALTGDHADADAHYMAADVIFLAHDRRRTHLCSAQGAWWADWLVRTGRCEAADVLLSHNKALSAARGEHQNVARCDRVLAMLSTCRGDLHEAYELLTAAMRTFRAGDYLVELAAVLADLAECARQTGLLELGERHAAEAIAIAAPRGLVAAESAAWLLLPAFRPTAASLQHLTAWPLAALRLTWRCGAQSSTDLPGANWMPCAPTPTLTS